MQVVKLNFIIALVNKNLNSKAETQEWHRNEKKYEQE